MKKKIAKHKLSKKARAEARKNFAATYAKLEKIYPTAHCALDHENPLQLLVATILSAQCTDVRVNMVTPALFAKYPTVRDFAEADLEELKKLIRSTGFYSNKAKNIKAAAQRIVEVYHGEVPRTLAELITLNGVARKTANVVLWNAFGKNEGIVVDTHVGRTSYRLGWTDKIDPGKIEKDLLEITPEKNWGQLSHLLIYLGRDVCKAPKPICGKCRLRDVCPWFKEVITEHPLMAQKISIPKTHQNE